MGTTLTGLTPSTTYDALIKVGDNGPIDGTLKTLSDGLGNDLPVQASTTAVNFTATLTQSGTALQPVLVSGTSIKTVNSNSLLGAGDVAVQPTLVSGVSIKTVNSTSLLGSGDIPIPIVTPSGVSGAIQFSNGSAFASDAANFFWDNTNKRLGIGTNAPTQVLDIVTTTQIPLKLSNNQTFVRTLYSNNSASGTFDFINNYFSFGGNNLVVGSSSNLNARLGVVGSGSTSATTSLLVQNSAGSEAFRVYDDRTAVFSNSLSVPNSTISTIAIVCTSGVFAPSGGNGVKWGNNVYAISSSNGILKISDNSDADFNRLQFGGTSSAYPSLKRSSTTLQARLADDSGYAPIDASLYKVGGTNGFTGTGSYTNFTIVGGIITNAS